jgi:uncharacterized protein YqgV (UPF0045/DUF77 family)
LKPPAEDGDITASGTICGEEVEELQEILKEKDQIIDMLTKEKNYYVKKVDHISKLPGTMNNKIEESNTNMAAVQL